MLEGRTITSWPSLETDTRNAGGTWVDQEVCRDGNLVSSRMPDDLPAFTAAMLDVRVSTARVTDSSRSERRRGPR